MGSFCWKEFFAALREIGYQGRYDIESFMKPGGTVSASVALWRDLQNDADREQEDEMLRNSIRFIEEMV